VAPDFGPASNIELILVEGNVGGEGNGFGHLRCPNGGVAVSIFRPPEDARWCPSIAWAAAVPVRSILLWEVATSL
jgi:hypothetical protein